MTSTSLSHLRSNFSSASELSLFDLLYDLFNSTVVVRSVVLDFTLESIYYLIRTPFKLASYLLNQMLLYK